MYFPNDGTHTIHLLRAHKRLMDAGDRALKTIAAPGETPDTLNVTAVAYARHADATRPR